LVGEDDRQALVKEGLGVQPEADRLRRELLLAEDLRVGTEEDPRAGAARRADLLQLRRRLAALVGLLPAGAVALDLGDHLLGERVDDRRTDAVEAARELVL